MQNTNDTTTTTTTTTTSTAPTLAELLAARAEERAEYERDDARRAQIAREDDRAAALVFVQDFMREHISQELVEALRMTPTVDDSLLDVYHDDGPNTMPGYLMLDVSGAGVDDSEEARIDPNRDDRWNIARVYRQYMGYAWMIRGPREYSAEIGEPYSYEAKVDRGIIDAIAHYPVWLAGAAERRVEQERKQRAEEERQKPATVRHFTMVESERRDDRWPAMLTEGTRLRVRILNPRGEDGIMVYSGSLQSWSAQWLLLNVDDHERGSIGAQRLIPTARVLDIIPLPDLPDNARGDDDRAA